MQPNDDFDAIKAEIAFFMEKMFQISLSYSGAIVALGAAIHLDIGGDIERVLGVHPAVTFVAVLLGLNALYLTLALGTLFAVFKRGLFLIEFLDGAAINRRWEIFTRRRNGDGSVLERVFWNADMYFVVFLFGIVIAISIGAAGVGFAYQENTRDLIAVIAATALQLFPALVGAGVVWLQQKARKSAGLARRTR